MKFSNLVLLFLLGGCSTIAPQGRPEEVKLVLQITIDQLRGDFVNRFRSNFGEGGFRYLLDNGIHYANAHYQHANTETGPGHATLATGALPSVHGIIGNNWINSSNGELVYNTEDSRHHIIGTAGISYKGVSPKNMLSSTVGDELVINTVGRSRAFSVSAKDRGAILPGGHTGKAFWYSKKNGRFVTSTYYYKDYPQWVDDWNAEGGAAQYKGDHWKLLLPRKLYINKDSDDRSFEANFDTLGTTFPHPLGDGTSEYFNEGVYFTPMVDELSLSFSKRLIESEKLGKRGFVDYLAVSFSSPDLAGHLFGPASLEYEDAVIRIDRLLSDLFAHLDERIGLKNVLIVLSSDHGGPEASELEAALGLEAHRLPYDVFGKDSLLGKKLKHHYGRDDLLIGHSHPYIYLNLEAVKQMKLDICEVEKFVASEVVNSPGIMSAFTRCDLMRGSKDRSPIETMVRHNFHPQRSGNIHVIAKPYWYFDSDGPSKGLESKGYSMVHGSPWRYDTFVPIFFAGPQIPKGKVSRSVSPADVAPTIAAYLGINPPSGSSGEPLKEVVE